MIIIKLFTTPSQTNTSKSANMHAKRFETEFVGKLVQTSLWMHKRENKDNICDLTGKFANDPVCFL